MNDSEPAPQAPEEGEVGLVEYQDFVSREPFHFESGGTIPELTLRYETYGHLNAAKDNAIIICHALSGNLCRCTGYVKPLEAAKAAMDARNGEVTS